MLGATMHGATMPGATIMGTRHKRRINCVSPFDGPFNILLYNTDNPWVYDVFRNSTYWYLLYILATIKEQLPKLKPVTAHKSYGLMKSVDWRNEWIWSRKHGDQAKSSFRLYLSQASKCFWYARQYHFCRYFLLHHSLFINAAMEKIFKASCCKAIPCNATDWRERGMFDHFSFMSATWKSQPS